MNEEFRKFLIDELGKIKEYTLSDGIGVYNTYTYALKKYDEFHKPVAIPKFMSDWIEENRERYKNTFFSIGYDIYSNAIHPPVDDWIIENQEKFVRAWFDAYKIEEEPLYYALIKGHELSSDNLKYWHCEAYHLGRVLIGAKHPKQRCINRMTKKNWKIYGINESNADFEEVQG